MCGRYSLETDDYNFYERFGLAERDVRIASRYNIAPSQTLPVVTEAGDLKPMQWGFIPFYAKEPKGIINARAETVATNGAFKRAFQTSRCLVPASGFYEWQKTEAGDKLPYYIHVKDEPLFAFAGITTTWTDPQGQPHDTYAIITTEPNELMAPIHNRMPVILPRDAEARWLNPDETEPEHLVPLLVPYPAAQMAAYPISRAVNSPRNDSPSILTPLTAAAAA